jgi:GAF domain-containing protein
VAWTHDVTRLDPTSRSFESWRSGKTLIANDLQGCEEPVITSVMYLPLRARDRVLGLLTLIRYNTGSRPFDGAEGSAGEALASHAALALAKAQLRAIERRESEDRERMEGRLRLLSDAVHECVPCGCCPTTVNGSRPSGALIIAIQSSPLLPRP